MESKQDNKLLPNRSPGQSFCSEDVIDETSIETKDPVMAGVRKYNLAQRDLFINKDEINILVLYTGGTLGMSKVNGSYVPIKNWLLQKLHSNNLFYDEQYSKLKHKEGTSCTPKTYRGNRLRYHINEFDPLIDSSELNSRYYAKIAEAIEKEYDNYDSFIVIYGTDTMAYMASQLSFMFENLSKTI